MYNQIQDAEVFAGRIVNVDYHDDRQFVPLQAADLLAWQVRRAFCETREPRRKHFDNCRGCTWEPATYVVTRKDLEEGLVLMEERAKAYAAALGVPLCTIQPWKKKTQKKI